MMNRTRPDQLTTDRFSGRSACELIGNIFVQSHFISTNIEHRLIPRLYHTLIVNYMDSILAYQPHLNAAKRLSALLCPQS